MRAPSPLAQVFAPLAKLLGVYVIKEELEELALQYMQPEIYTNIRRWQVCAAAGTCLPSLLGKAVALRPACGQRSAPAGAVRLRRRLGATVRHQQPPPPSPVPCPCVWHQQDKQAKEQQQAYTAGKADLEALLQADSYLLGHARGISVHIKQKPVFAVYKQLLALQVQAAGSDDALDGGSEPGDAAASAGNADGGVGSNGSQLGGDKPAAGPKAGGGSSGGPKTLLSHLREVPERGVYLQVSANHVCGAASKDRAAPEACRRAATAAIISVVV